MQPYFMPYIGYFQLIDAVDEFVIYDNIKFTKKGWVNRNRFLRNGEPVIFTLPVRKDSDSLDVVQRYISDDFDSRKLLSQIQGAYSKAPFFHEAYPVIEKILLINERNMFRYIYHSVICVAEYLNIGTRIVISSDIDSGTLLGGNERVYDLCKRMNAATYINPIGGRDLYDKSQFALRGLELLFHRSKLTPYRQFGGQFVAALSILDLMMFVSRDELQNFHLHDCEFV
ncbi:MAG: WbqC family protein [Gammaproteobacteria bacterium]|nr:WbqC family protein [Gammaproteobacteria bacterium]MCP5135984.1 WbqC family protein [Gammaproteobacteria bacterium]